MHLTSTPADLDPLTSVSRRWRGYIKSLLLSPNLTPLLQLASTRVLCQDQRMHELSLGPAIASPIYSHLYTRPLRGSEEDEHLALHEDLLCSHVFLE